MHDTSWSPWTPVSSATTQRSDAVDDAAAVDVLVIGAGVVGLSAAVELADRGASVVVLDAGEIGGGASGRNAGHLSPVPGRTAAELVRRYGADAARDALTVGRSGVAAIEGLIERFGIEAHYQPHGNLTVALHDRELDGLRAEVELQRRLGGNARFVERGELAMRRIPGGFVAAVEQPCGGVLDPGAYVRGLAEGAARSGVRVITNAPVTHLAPGAPVIATTPAGVVRARRVVVATGAFTSPIRRGRRLAVPVRVRCLRTAPLGGDRWAEVGWDGGEGLATTHAITENHRRTHDGRIIAGTRLVAYRVRSARSLADDERLDAVLEAAFRRRFPELRDVPIDGRWGGWVDMSVDSLPSIHRFGRSGELLMACGFSGHGLSFGTEVGRRLAAAALDDAPTGPLLGRRVRRWPIEPVRWIGARATIALLDRRNRALDRAAPVPPQGLEP